MLLPLLMNLEMFGEVVNPEGDRPFQRAHAAEAGALGRAPVTGTAFLCRDPAQSGAAFGRQHAEAAGAARRTPSSNSNPCRRP